jgi:hypothetical protein
MVMRASVSLELKLQERLEKGERERGIVHAFGISIWSMEFNLVDYFRCCICEFKLDNF